MEPLPNDLMCRSRSYDGHFRNKQQSSGLARGSGGRGLTRLTVGRNGHSEVVSNENEIVCPACDCGIQI